MMWGGGPYNIQAERLGARGLAVTAAAEFGMDLIVWLLLLVVLAIAGGVTIVRWRRRFLTGEGSMAESGWGLADLEKMRQSGQLTDQEFKVLRQHLLGQRTAPRPQTRANESTSAAETNDNN